MPGFRGLPYGFVFLLGALVACDDAASKGGRDASSDADTGNMGLGRTAQGLVINAKDGKPLGSANLVTNGQTAATSNAKGEFSLALGPSDSHATVTRDAFAPTERSLPAISGSLTVYLKAVDQRVTFRGDEGVNVALPSGEKLEIPKGAVIDAEGKRVPDEVTLELAIIDGKRPNEAGALPGNATAERKNGQAGHLSVRTGLSIRIFDAESKELSVDKDVDVVAELPADKDVDQELSVYSYAGKEQRWQEEGSAKRSMNAEGKAVYRADIEHLSWWSLGRFFDALTCVRACVRDGDGKAVAGAQVWVVGASTPGVSQFFTGEDGCGGVDVIAEADVVLVAQAEALVSEALPLQTGEKGPSFSNDPESCVDAGVLRVGAASSSSCLLCSVDPAPSEMDGGMEPMLDASLPLLDAGMDGSISLPEAGTDASLPLEAGTSVDAGAPSTSLIQQGFLKASNPDTNDFFGEAIAISGNTLVVGAPNERSNATTIDGNQDDDSASNAGAAYVFVRSGNSWTQQAYLKANNTQTNDTFGRAVAIDGDTIVIGAPSEDSDSSGVNGAQNENAAGAGAAYVFVRSGTTWALEAFLKPTNTGPGDGFGTSVAISNNTIAVGAPFEDSGLVGEQNDESALSAGAAYVYVRSGGAWAPSGYLKASNLEASDEFGRSISVDGNTVLVGAPGEDSGLSFMPPDPNPNDNTESDSGAAYVFVQNGTAWSQQAYLKSINPDAGDDFGESVSISGDFLVVGASSEDSSDQQINGDNPQDNSAQSNGAAYVYSRTGGNWFFDTYLKARNGQANHDFGDSVSIDGPFIVVGAFQDDSPSTTINGSATQGPDPASVGSAFLYQRTPVGWVEKAYLKGSNSAEGDWFGKSVGVSGLTTIVGAYRQGGTTGAVYVFFDQST